MELTNYDKENLVQLIVDLFSEHIKGLSINQIHEILDLSKDAFQKLPLNY